MAEFLQRRDGFTDFLQRKQPLAPNGLDDDHAESLIARNFLLDEGVAPARADTYAAAGAAIDHPGYSSWKGSHQAYLTNLVFRTTNAAGPPGSLNPNDIDCPETFQSVDTASPFLASFQGLDLVRVEEIGFLARVSGVSDTRIRELAEQISSGTDPATLDGARQELDAILAVWETKIELRPTFAGFWDDVAEFFGNTPADDRPDWAGQLRDRFGLFHLDPGRRTVPEIPILVFRILFRKCRI